MEEQTKPAIRERICLHKKFDRKYQFIVTIGTIRYKINKNIEDIGKQMLKTNDIFIAYSTTK